MNDKQSCRLWATTTLHNDLENANPNRQHVDGEVGEAANVLKLSTPFRGAGQSWRHELELARVHHRLKSRDRGPEAPGSRCTSRH